jgi:gliding motility-associated lipoprotein GldB
MTYSPSLFNYHLRDKIAMRLFPVFCLFLPLLLNSCSNEQEEKCAAMPDVSSVKVDVKVTSLEDVLPAIKAKPELVSFFSDHQELRDLFFNRPAYPNDSVFINELYNRFTNPAIDTLLMETHRVFGNGEELKNEFDQAFTYLKYYYPDFNAPEIQTVITGLESDVYVDEKVAMVGLDYYLGETAKYRPYMHDYMLRRYNKNFIVPSVMLLYGIDDAYNKTNLEDKTVLADMITYGKAYYFAKQMMPCVPDSILIGYTREEIEGSRKNESLIWSRFIEDEVLFETSHQVKQKYISERPKTLEVGDKCPGRIGTWIGWQIVNRYMETHPSVTLPQLMQMTDAAKFFKESGYKPQVTKLPKRDKIGS